MLWGSLKVIIVLNTFWSLSTLQVASIVLGIETSVVAITNLKTDFGTFENVFNIHNITISIHIIFAYSLDIIPSFTETRKASLGLAHPFSVLVNIRFNVTNI